MPSLAQIDSFPVSTPMGCHLQAINGVQGVFAWPAGAAEFDRLLTHGHGKGPFKGLHFTGTIVSIQTNSGDLYEKTVEELKKRGFQLLGTQPGAHGAYKMELWGEGFTLPEKEKHGNP